jgi:predicted RND superfamily exporter protein
MFMRYSIGFDMGLVLTKGILLSLITVFALMPSLLILLNKVIEKTSHKMIKLSFKGLFNLLKKSRFILPPLLLILIAAAAWAQYQNDFIYGDSASMGGKGSRLYDDRIVIEQSFGVQNQHMLLVPVSEFEKDAAASQALAENKYVERINSYTTAKNMAESFGEELLPQMEAQFKGDDYFRIILYLNVDDEGEDSFDAVKQLRQTAAAHFGEYYLLGPSASVFDIKEVTDFDYTVIMAISIALVLLILVFSFKSVVLPVLLIFVIQGSIWINFAYPYVFSQPIIFIGCVMVSSIQLGSTIDYGIILGNGYLNHRKTMGKFDAALESLQENKHAIITSATIMSAAGFALSIASSMPGVSMMGVLVGRGALSSGLLVLTLLPQLFMLFDKAIGATTIKGSILNIFKRKKNKPATAAENGNLTNDEISNTGQNGDKTD